MKDKKQTVQEQAEKLEKKWIRIVAVIQSILMLVAVSVAIGFFLGKNYESNQAKQVHSQVETLANSVKK